MYLSSTPQAGSGSDSGSASALILVLILILVLTPLLIPLPESVRTRFNHVTVLLFRAAKNKRGTEAALNEGSVHRQEVCECLASHT